MNLLQNFDNQMEGFVAIADVHPSFLDKKGRIYIAGPMRGYPAYNFPAFYAAEKYLFERGWECGNPARMDDEGDGPDAYTVMPGNQGVRLAMERDLLWIARNADAIYMLRGWEKSSGAAAEYALAKTLGLDIYYQETI